MSDEGHPCLEAIVSRYDGPIERPISFDRETGQMKVEGWMIKIYKHTKTGNVSKSGGGYLRVTFCPLCGERLIPEET